MESGDLKDRLGKIKIDEHLIWDLRSMSAIFSACIVLQVDRIDFNRVWVYTIACPHFDRLVPGEAIPEYTVILHNNFGSVTIEKWEKVRG